MYNFYLQNVLLPITPSKMDLKINGNNKTYQLINEGQINVLKNPALSEITFDAILPSVDSHLVNGTFANASYYLSVLESRKLSKSPFQFIVTRTTPSGKRLFNTNMTVSLEDYTVKEDANNGLDLVVSIRLKQYKFYGTKVVAMNIGKPVAARKVDTPKADTTKSTQNYTVQKGDCLWNIAKKVYGDGSKYTLIAEANKGSISNPNLIYPNQQLVIPALK